jgi:hypothetical protein
VRYSTHTFRPRTTRGIYGLGGAFDLNTTVVPGDTSLVASVPTATKVDAAASAYTKVAPLLSPAPAPLTVLKSATVTTLDEGNALIPSGAAPMGTYGGTETVPGVVFSEYGTPEVSDSTGVDTASTDVAEAHDSALDPGVVVADDALPSGDDVGVTLYTPPPPVRQQPRAASSSGSGWLWALGAVAVVGGVGFVLFRRR